MKYQECYAEGKAALQQAEIAEADLDARLLLEHICGTNRNDLLVHGDREVEEEKLAAYRTAIAKRSERIPLQHITGIQDFMGLEFKVNEHVLIPRQDTEILVEEIMREMQDNVRILDMCTGSGCILISLLHYSNWCEGVGVDISVEALKVACGNGEALLPEEKRPRWVESNLFEKVEVRFDIIVSNPPYIRTEVIDTLMPEVRLHEPIQALDGTEDGLFFYRRIVEEAPSYLIREGRLYFEIGHDQAKEVSALMEKAGFSDIRVVKDYAGLDRVVCGILR
ncbi:MAG: peptide chain release factor N(5)-glutamine methyltransferase [Lachnospiraceae bacterium]|nr:peptide chain release factor N(5)-glutamine methyltransferase [Lachnospiraceae bacterium]